MDIALWIAQILLALVLLGAGAAKLSQPKEKLEARMAWATDFSQPVIRVIGTAEVLGALGLVLPAATGIVPVLTPLAATGLALIQLGAVVTHARRRELPMIAVNAVLIAIAAFIAWGRFGPYAF